MSSLANMMDGMALGSSSSQVPYEGKIFVGGITSKYVNSPLMIDLISAARAARIFFCIFLSLAKSPVSLFLGITLHAATEALHSSRLL